eukprot:scaffold38289_cov25-Cyclotella_meneghiniana.AAC.1
MKSIFAITMMLAAAASADYTSQSDAQIRSLYGDIEEDYMMSPEHQYEGELDEYEEEFDTVSLSRRLGKGGKGSKGSKGGWGGWYYPRPRPCRPQVTYKFIYVPKYYPVYPPSSSSSKSGKGGYGKSGKGGYYDDDYYYGKSGKGGYGDDYYYGSGKSGKGSYGSGKSGKGSYGSGKSGKSGSYW